MVSSSNIFHNIIHDIQSPKQESLVVKLSLIAFAIKVGTSIIVNLLNQYGVTTTMLVSKAGVIVFFCVLGMAGVVVIIRQELPQAIVVRGKTAVVYGLIWFIVSWVLMIRYIYLLAVDIMEAVSLGLIQ